MSLTILTAKIIEYISKRKRKLLKADIIESLTNKDNSRNKIDMLIRKLRKEGRLKFSQRCGWIIPSEQEKSEEKQEIQVNGEIQKLNSKLVALEQQIIHFNSEVDDLKQKNKNLNFEVGGLDQKNKLLLFEVNDLKKKYNQSKDETVISAIQQEIQLIKVKVSEVKITQKHQNNGENSTEETKINREERQPDSKIPLDPVARAKWEAKAKNGLSLVNDLQCAFAKANGDPKEILKQIHKMNSISDTPKIQRPVLKQPSGMDTISNTPEIQESMLTNQIIN